MTIYAIWSSTVNKEIQSWKRETHLVFNDYSNTQPYNQMLNTFQPQLERKYGMRISIINYTLNTNN